MRYMHFQLYPVWGINDLVKIACQDLRPKKRQDHTRYSNIKKMCFFLLSQGLKPFIVHESNIQYPMVH
jgi:hypothetical protein